IRALQASLPAASLRLRTAAALVEGVADGYRVRTTAGETFGGRVVVVATPAYATASLLREVASEVSRVCGDIRYASAVTVSLAFRRESVQHPLNGSGFVVPRAEKTGIMAGSWLSSKWPNRAPEGFVLLRAFLGGARDPGAITKSDRDLVDTAMRALRPLLGITGEPLFTRIYRWERANAQHEVGHLDRMAAIDRSLASRPGLFITGSGFRGVGIPDCIADGRATARQVSTWLGSSVS
ncbi:MAG: protoporphyrinogen oxidase, partial [Vicinamibacterales bacterium]